VRDWSEELSTEERDAWIEKISRGIVARGMATPAVLFLEMHKPLAFVASQGLVMTSGFTAPFVGMDNLQAFTKLIEKRENVELLVQRIEELAEERPGPNRPQKPESADNEETTG
jgi:hypothetical protein